MDTIVTYQVEIVERPVALPEPPPLPVDWHLFVTPPSVEEQAEMDRNALLLLADLEGIA